MAIINDEWGFRADDGSESAAFAFETTQDYSSASLNKNLFSIRNRQTEQAAVTNTGAWKGPIIDKGGQVYNVKAYGAKGDGTTDDTAAIVAADTAAAAGTRKGVVWFPEGTYNIETKVSPTAGVLWEGPSNPMQEGASAKLVSKVVGDACVQVGDDTSIHIAGGLRNLAIIADASISGNGTGLMVIYAWYGIFENIRIEDFSAGTGFHLSGGTSANTPSIQNHLSHIYTANCLTGVHFDGRDAADTSSVDETMVSDVRVNLDGLANAVGFLMERGVGNNIDRLSVYDNVAAGTSGTVALKIVGGAQSRAYQPKQNRFGAVFLENARTTVQFGSGVHGNRISVANITLPSTYDDVVVDDSEGANVIEYMGGEDTGNALAYHNSQSPINLIKNGEFERWEYGVSGRPRPWSATAGVSFSREGTTVRRGSYSLRLTNTSGTDESVSQNLFSVAPHLAGKTVTIGAWCHASNASTARLFVNDGVGTYSSEYHSGGGGWEYLSTRVKLNGSATQAIVNLRVETANTVYWDGVVAVEGTTLPESAERPLLDSDRLTRTDTWDPANMNDGEVVSTTVTIVGAATGDPCVASHSGIGANDVLISAHVSAANTITVVLQNKTGGALNIASGDLKVIVFKA